MVHTTAEPQQTTTHDEQQHERQRVDPDDGRMEGMRCKAPARQNVQRSNARRGSEDGGGEREWRANWTVDLNRKKSILLCLIGCTQAKM
jgi:hypothetical protein